MALTLVLGLFPALTPRVHAEGGNEARVTIGGETTEYATLTINDGTVGSFCPDTPAVRSENGVLKLEAKDGNGIQLSSSSEKCVEVMSGSLTMAGNPVPVYYDMFVQTNPSDFAMIAPAEGYTITADDAAMVEPNDSEFSSYLGDDGRIWAKYTHIHQHLYGYTQLENGKHQFDCACGETVTENCEYEWGDYDGEHWLGCSNCGQRDESSVEPHSPQANCLCECGAYAHQVEN